MMQTGKTVVLNESQSILLNDDDDILLSIITDGAVTDTYMVDYPNGGYGGGELILSPSGRYLVFSYFSGESEEAFLLLEISDRHLNPLYSSGYRCGEGTSYGFLEQETLLLETLRTGWWCEDTVQIDKSGHRFYEFGEIRLLDISQKKLEKHSIQVYPPSDWEEESDEGDFRLLTVTDRFLQLKTPWGEEAVPLPLGEVITFAL